MSLVLPKVKIFTDGACLNNPGPGGWAALLVLKQREKIVEKLLKGHKKNTTNNQMELYAVIKGLKALTKKCNVAIYSDSQYVVRGMKEWVFNWQKNNWKNSAKKEVANKNLWQQLLLEANKHKVSWHWVKAHSGHVENERVDEAARLAALKIAG
ncbi:ribonuclease HI [Sulfobacillus acidophilus]|uniref:Ribonuclease H n=1 Tax=Sulfobacillus acidophilus TaxID=53633 RepID=A0ABS3AWM3_9FIRM|nr:ribonuclease HI [Sulfobacillus acidophilus]